MSTTTVTTTAEVGQLPLSLTISSDSEGTTRTTSGTPTGGEKDEEMNKIITPDLRQGHDVQAAYPHFPTHPFRNPRHARKISVTKAPPQVQLVALHSDP